jgi:hypothetical protein
MTNVVDVLDETRTRIGAIAFDPSPAHLSVRRTASGFEMTLPITVRLEFKATTAPQPLVTDLSATITAIDDQQRGIFLGRARQEGWFTGSIPSSNVTSGLVWEAPLVALAAYEKFRDVQRPRFRIALLGQLSFLLPPASGRKVRTEPQQVYGDVEITYPTEVWIRAVREVGVLQAIYLEVPLPSSPQKPWDAVWRSVAEAAMAFERGGETGRRGAIVAIRQALDDWRSIDGEREDMGPGWKYPDKEDREKRTARQRLDAIRWHLREFAHLGAHSGAEHWSRQDAVLLLSSVSSLLALRRP